MRKIILSAVLFIATASFTTPLGGGPEKDIVRKWKPEENSIAVFRKMLIERTRKANPDMADQLEAAGDQLNPLVASITYEYKADGTTEIMSPQGPQKGTWKIVDDKYVVRVNGAGKETKDSIVSITSKEMKLYVFDVSDIAVYVPAE